MSPWANGDFLTSTNLNNKIVPVRNLKDYGATGNNVADDAPALRAAISSLGGGGGIVSVPSDGTYRIGSTITLSPNVCIVGMSGGRAPTLVFDAPTAAPLFSFLGTTEAATCGVALRNLFLDSTHNKRDIGIRIRNFSDIEMADVYLSHFSDGLWADWGQGVYADRCVASNCSIGMKFGGVGPAGGIRSGGTDFMDWVHVTHCGFAQNQYDIAHKGSHFAHGQCTLLGNTFFESSTPVSGKQHFVHVAGVKAFNAIGNTFELAQIRAAITLDKNDIDGTSQGSVCGGLVAGNEFLLNGGSGTTGVWLRAANHMNIQGNSFEALNPAIAHDVVDDSGTNFIGRSHYSSTGGQLVSGASGIRLNWGQMVFADGTATAPSVAFSSESSLGFYRSNTSTIADSYGQIQIRGGVGVGINGQPTAATLHVFGTGLFTSAVRGFDGTALTPSWAWSSEQSLGFFRSANSNARLSYGTLDTRGGALSVRTTASAGSSSALTNGELCLVAVSATSAQIAWRSGNTTYLFNAVVASP